MNEQSRAELDSFRKKFNRYYSIGDLTPTICELFGVRAPDCCGAVPVAPVVDHASKIMNGEGKLEKAVLFCADAMGDHQKKLFPEVFERIRRVAGLQIESTAVMASVTPVCYGTIFTGAAPAVHGIKHYEKPVLEVETLFDVLPQAGKRVAIACVNNCSIDMIFRKRNVDYYSFRNETLPFEWTRELIRRNEYDLIVCYMGTYDSTMHKKGCASPEAAEQARLAAERFEILSSHMDQYYASYNRALVFVPDHGGHDLEDGHGTHGTDLEEDMLLSHYYRLMEKKED